MATKIGVVAGASPALQNFAASVVSKATKNAVALGGATEAVSIALGASSVPKDAHTVVINSANATGAYQGAKATFIRSVLPRGAEDQLQLRDALDVFANSGINNANEVATAKTNMAETAKIAVAAAKASGNKLTVLAKQVSKYEQVNSIFQQVVEEAAQSAGVAVEVVDSASATNQLVMFPETSGVVVTADTAAADNIELALSGLYNTSRVFHRAGGAKTIPAGHSPATAAFAVADALKELGMSAESKKVAEAAAKASDVAGNTIVAAL